MANEARMREAVDYISSNPKEWDQRTWEYYKSPCGTTRCLAGTVIALHYQCFDESIYSIPSIEPYNIQQKAAKLLGLTHDEAESIFHYGVLRQPTLEEFKRRITDVTGIEFKSEEN